MKNKKRGPKEDAECTSKGVKQLNKPYHNLVGCPVREGLQQLFKFLIVLLVVFAKISTKRHKHKSLSKEDYTRK